jgi:hypothetical protein
VVCECVFAKGRILAKDSGKECVLARDSGEDPVTVFVVCRHAFPGMQKLLGRLVAYLKTRDPHQVLDMDNITCRETLDVIGMCPQHMPNYCPVGLCDWKTAIVSCHV